MLTRLLVFLFAVIMFGVGAALLWFGFGNLQKALQSPDWPTTAGKILSSEVVDAGENDMQFDAAVSFVYRVNGETLKGEKVQLDQWAASDVKSKRRVVRQFPEGRAVTVYYNPADPAEAVLVPGPTIGTWLKPGMGIGFTLFSLVIALAAIFGKTPEILNSRSPRVSSL
jgi:hypothetical protein